MIPIAVRKILLDLKTHLPRTILTIAAIGIGVLGAGTVIDSYAILSRELDVNYLATNPASATLYTERVDDAMIKDIQALPGIKDAEARGKVVGRIKIPGGSWVPAWFFVIKDYKDIRIDIISQEKGAWPPDTGEILFERQSRHVLPAETGNRVIAKVPFGGETELGLSGTTYAPGLAPAFMERTVYAYITSETFAAMGGKSGFNEIKITVAASPMDRTHIRKTAESVAAFIKMKGGEVTGIDVPVPGRHPHYTQMMTLLYLLSIFGFLALGLSGVLAANMIASVMAGQVREIGVLKAIGGNRRTISAMYFGMAVFLGLAAAASAMPLAAALGKAYSAFAAGILNFKIFDDSIPFRYFALQAAIGLLTPLLAAAFPILKGVSVPVRKALSDYGINTVAFGKGYIDRAIAHVGGTRRPLLLSLRNAVRKRGRTALTLATLSLGGAVFMTAMNVGASMDASVTARFEATDYDSQFTLSKPYPIGSIMDTVLPVPGVESAEGWGRTRFRIVDAEGPSNGDYLLTAPPAGTKYLSSMPIVEGRWLRPEDSSALVVNQRLINALPGTGLGDKVRLNTGGKETDWTIIGIVREYITEPGAYTNFEYFSSMTGSQGKAQTVTIVSKDRSRSRDLTGSVEAALAAAGMDVSRTDELAVFLDALREHLVIIAVTLALMSFMVVIVGGIGLSSSMSVNVLERTREIGVLRAIGATPGTLVGMILTESAALGLLSWAGALLMSFPVSAFLANRFGMIFFESPLTFALSPAGFAIWLGMSVLLSAAAGILPGLRAIRLSVRESLAYE